MSVLVMSDILGLFVNKGTAESLYFLCNRKNLLQPIHMQLPKKEIFFLIFFPHVFPK